MDKANRDSVYTTFAGGYDSFNLYDTDGSISNRMWSYTFLYGHLRFVYDETDLIDDWVHIGLHARNLELFGINIIPLSTDSKLKHMIFSIANFNWHIAYRKKFPWLKVGFNRIWPNLYKEDAIS